MKGREAVDDSQLDEAYRRWVRQEARPFGDDLRAALDELSPREAARWTVALARPRLTVAETLTEWLKPPGDLPWRVAGGLDWDAVTTSRQELVMVPLPLADDPLAMAAICPVWAVRGPVERCRWMVERLGPALAPALYGAGYMDKILAPCLGGWVRRYRAEAESLGLGPVVAWAEAESSAAIPALAGEAGWPKWPSEVERFRDHLARGLVPHRERGKSPEDPAAVLLALAAMRSPAGRAEFTELAVKAIQGALISARWRAAAEEEDKPWS